MFDGIVREAILIVAVVSGVPLVASALTGLVVSVLQAVTQLQEQSIGYLAKLIAVGIALAVCGPWFLTLLVELLQRSLAGLGSLGSLG